MVIGRILDTLRKVVEPSGEEAVGIVGSASGLEPVDSQRAFIATYAGTRGLRLIKIVEASSKEEAEKAIRELGKGRIVLIYSSELVSREAFKKAKEWGVKEIVIVKGSLSGPKMGC